MARFRPGAESRHQRRSLIIAKKLCWRKTNQDGERPEQYVFREKLELPAKIVEVRRGRIGLLISEFGYSSKPWIGIRKTVFCRQVCV